MNKLLRALSAPLSVIALCLVATQPWWRLQAVCSDDLSLHLLRTVQLKSLLQQGVLYSRWAPDMGLGYGYPLPNFYAPLAYYITASLSLLVGNVQQALIATLALAPIAAGLAMYRLARDYFSPRSALVAAVAYAYAPYLSYDALFRGNLAETLAWVFPPLALWAMGRLARSGGRKILAGTALAYAAILLTHNVFALIFSPLLAAYGLLTALTLPTRSLRRPRMIAVGVALLLGLGSAAFFWLPAMAEQAYVHIDRLLVPPTFAYWNNFLDLRELLAAPRTVHPDLLNPSPPRTLGLVPVALGLPALIGLWRFHDRPRRVQIAFFAAGFITYAWLTTASSRPVWDTAPLLEYTQFPWRLLAPAALCLAMLTAAIVDLFPDDRRGTLLSAAAITLLVIGAMFWLSPRYCSWVEESPTTSSIAHFEQQRHLIGTTAKGEYTPLTVKTLPEEIATTVLDPASLPPGTEVFQEQVKPIGAELTVTATAPFVAIYNGFDYPGWRVTVDGRKVPITPDTPHGRITFPVPAGRHHVAIRFGETPMRLVADCISLACLILVAGLMLLPQKRMISKETTPPQRISLTWAGWGLALLGLAILLQRLDNPLRHPGLQDSTLAGIEHPVNRRYADGLTLIGYEQSHTSLPADGTPRIGLYWTVYARPSAHYQSVIHLVGPDGLRWSMPDTFCPSGYDNYPPTVTWSPDRYALDSQEIIPLPGTPPGTYDIVLTTFNRHTLATLSVLNEQSQPIAPDLTLGQVTLTRPRRPAAPPDDDRLDLALGDLTLLVAGLDRDQATPGDLVLITTYWRAEKKMAEDITSRLTLLAPDGTLAAEYDLALTADWYPTSMWQPGDVWRGQHLFHLPADLDSGAYSWQISLSPANQPTNLPSTIHITAPPHTFAPPTLPYTLNTTLGEMATLVSFDIEPGTTNLQPGTSITITLIWRAEETPDTSYHVFLHLLDPEGRLMAQSDGVPAGWTRPTTGWLPGEYITDVHNLAIPADAPAGEYVLQNGLYDPDTGTRLIDPTGADTIPLTTIVVEEP